MATVTVEVFHLTLNPKFSSSAPALEQVVKINNASYTKEALQVYRPLFLASEALRDLLVISYRKVATLTLPEVEDTLEKNFVTDKMVLVAPYLDKVWELTNHGANSVDDWTQNAGVEVEEPTDFQRSSMVGDIFVFAGSLYVVAPFGFERLGPATE